jgi:hypothetical protein
VRTGPIAETRLSHLICPRRLRVEAGFGTWSPVRCSAGRGGCRGFIGPVPLPLSIRLPMNIARRPRCVKRFYAFSIKQILFPLFVGEGCARWSAHRRGWMDDPQIAQIFADRKSLQAGVVGLHPHHDTGAAANFKRSRLDLDWHPFEPPTRLLPPFGSHDCLWGFFSAFACKSRHGGYVFSPLASLAQW